MKVTSSKQVLPIFGFIVDLSVSKSLTSIVQDVRQNTTQTDVEINTQHVYHIISHLIMSPDNLLLVVSLLFQVMQ